MRFMSIVSLALGIIALPCAIAGEAFTFSLFGKICCLAGIVFGIIGVKHYGYCAKFALLLNIVALVWNVVVYLTA